MLGSAIIEVWVRENGKEEKIVFTGDLGNDDIPLLASPARIGDADYLVMESTYGNRLHIRNNEKAKIFLDIISKTIDRGGTVVIPSFAVGRTQEILYELNNIKDNSPDEEFLKKYEKLMKVPVYVDSPLAISATEVFKENMDLFDEETQALIRRGDNPLDFDGLKFTRTADESKELNMMEQSSIIISASGMCEVGRIKHHLKHNIWNPLNTILFVGYQAPGTLGRRIIDGEKNIKIFGEDIAVNAQIEYIEGYSGHADQNQLINFVKGFQKRPKHIFLVHGEEQSQLDLKQRLLQEMDGFDVTIPEFGEEYELDDHIHVHNHSQKHNPNRFLRLEVIDRVKNLREELDDMELILKEDYLHEDAREEDIEKIRERLKELEAQIVKIVENK